MYLGERDKTLSLLKQKQKSVWVKKRIWRYIDISKVIWMNLKPDAYWTDDFESLEDLDAHTASKWRNDK